MKLNSTKNLPHHPKYILIYGASGIGKTSLVATLTDASKVLVLDAERGLASLKGKGVDVQYKSLCEDDSGMVLTEAQRFEEFKRFIDFVQTAECKQQFNTLYLDSLTEIAQNIQRHMKEKYEGYKLWGEYTSAVQDLIKFFRDLNHYTIIFTALEERIDEDDGKCYYFPNVGGRKVKEAILPAFDLVARMVLNENSERLLVCKPTTKTQAKDRMGTLEPTELPDLGALLNKMI